MSSERTRSVKRAISGVVAGDDRKRSLDLRWSGDDGGDVGGGGGDGWENVGVVVVCVYVSFEEEV